MNLKIGTRGSKLALTQTNFVAEKLKKLMPEAEIEICVIKTSGDIMQDVSLLKIGGQGVFVKELEEALLSCKIDLAVHSMKDVPGETPDGLMFAGHPAARRCARCSGSARQYQNGVLCQRGENRHRLSKARRAD